MDFLFVTPAVAADAAADAALGNIRKQKDLEFELKELDKKWLIALKQIVNDRLDLLKELDRIAKLKVHRDYFQDNLRKARLRNYTDHVRSRMRRQKYLKTHDNFNFTVDPLSKQIVLEPMIMEGDSKEGREMITSTSLDKKRAKHMRGLSELEVKVRRFRVPKAKKQKPKKNELPPLPEKILRLKRMARKQVKFDSIPEVVADEESDSGEENEDAREKQATSIFITHHTHESEQEAFERTSVFTIPGEQIPFARAYIPLTPIVLTPEPSFVEDEDNSLKIPNSPSQITTRLLSPKPDRKSRLLSPNEAKAPRARSPSFPRARSPLPPRPSNTTEKPAPFFPDIQKAIPNESVSKPKVSKSESLVLPDINQPHQGVNRDAKPKTKKGTRKAKRAPPKDVGGRNAHTDDQGVITASRNEQNNNRDDPKFQDMNSIPSQKFQTIVSDHNANDTLPSDSNQSQALQVPGESSQSQTLQVPGDKLFDQSSPVVLTKKQQGLVNLSKSLNKARQKSRKLSTVVE